VLSSQEKDILDPNKYKQALKNPVSFEFAIFNFVTYFFLKCDLK
jgi:hypothetical protein